MRLLLAALVACSACTRAPPAAPPAAALGAAGHDRHAARGPRGCLRRRAARTPQHRRAWPARASLFERAYSPVPLTLPAHATLLTGPAAAGSTACAATARFALGPAPRTLAEALRAAASRPRRSSAAFPLARRFGLDRGFDVYDDAFERAPGLHFEFPERRADRVVEAAAAWLAAPRARRSSGSTSTTPTRPTIRPPRFRGADPYRGEIAFADAMLGRLLSALGRAARARGRGARRPITARPSASTARRATACSSTTPRCACRCCCAGPACPPAAGVVPQAIGLVDLAATLAELRGRRGAARGEPDALSSRATAARPRLPLYAETLAPRLDFGWSELRAWRDGRAQVRAARRGPSSTTSSADPGESAQPRRDASRDAATRDGGRPRPALQQDWERRESRRAA